METSGLLLVNFRGAVRAVVAQQPYKLPSGSVCAPRGSIPTLSAYEEREALRSSLFAAALSRSRIHADNFIPAVSAAWLNSAFSASSVRRRTRASFRSSAVIFGRPGFFFMAVL